MLKYVNINTLFIGLLSLFFGYNLISYYLQKPDPYEIPIGALPVPIQVGKNKIIVSKTGDASMGTEYKRRRAIIGANSCGITPKFSYQGSTNGSLETYFLTSMCPTFIKDIAKACTSVFDGGNAESEFCYVLDGNGGSIVVDGGGADTNVCAT